MSDTVLAAGSTEPAPGPDLETRVGAIVKSLWWGAWCDAFSKTGDVAKPSVRALVLELNGLRYNLKISLAGIARAYANFCGGADSAGLMRACAARLAMFGDVMEGLNEEHWFRLLMSSIGRLCDRMTEFKLDDRTSTQKVFLEISTGMAICAGWFKESYGGPI